MFGSTGFRSLRKIVALAVIALVCLPGLASAQNSPWERAAANLEFTFTGPLARSLDSSCFSA